MRLTNAIRNNVLDAVNKKIIQPKIENVKKELDHVVRFSANRLYSDKITKWIKSAPKGGLTSYSKIYLTVGGRNFYNQLIHDCDHRPYFSLYTSLKVLAEDQYNYSVPLHDDVVDKFNMIKGALVDIQKESDKIHSVISSSLWACNTVKQLEEHYPDLVQYLPKIEKAAKSLAVTNDKVHAILRGES